MTVESSCAATDPTAAQAMETQARVAAFMGLRIMSEQAAQLAKHGSMIPHLYPERQLSRLPNTPAPLGKLLYLLMHGMSQYALRS